MNEFDVMFGYGGNGGDTSTVSSSEGLERNEYDVMFGYPGKKKEKTTAPTKPVTPIMGPPVPPPKKSVPMPGSVEARAKVPPEETKRRLMAAGAAFLNIPGDITGGIIKQVGKAGENIFNTFLPKSLEVNPKKLAVVDKKLGIPQWATDAAQDVVTPKTLPVAVTDFIGDAVKWGMVASAAGPVGTVAGGIAKGIGVAKKVQTATRLAGASGTAGVLGGLTAEQGEESQDILLGAGGELLGNAIWGSVQAAKKLVPHMKSVSKAFDDLGLAGKDVDLRGANVQDKVKEAYRKLAMKYHPDRAGGNAEAFDLATKAAKTLRDNPITARVMGIARKFNLAPETTYRAMANEAEMLRLPAPQQKVVQSLKDDIERLGNHLAGQDTTQVATAAAKGVESAVPAAIDATVPATLSNAGTQTPVQGLGKAPATSIPGQTVTPPVEAPMKVKSEPIHPLVQEQIDILKKEGGQGVTQGFLQKDDRGDVIGQVGRQSNNPQWYRDFYAANGRKPNNTDLRKIAEDRLVNGYTDENYGPVEPNEEYVMAKFDEDMAKVTPKPEPVMHVTETPGGTMKTSGLAKSIEQKAKDTGLVGKKGFDSLAQYGSTSIKEQEGLFNELVSSGVENLKAVLRGDAPLLDGQSGSAVVENVERFLKKNPDSDLAYDLANSPYTAEASQAGSSLSMLQNREKDSVVAKMNAIRKAREDRVMKRGSEKIAKEVSREVKKVKSQVHLSKDELQWESFVNKILC